MMGTMDGWILGIVMTWLGIVSWFDLRRQEIPHSAWVIIPLAGALVYRIWLGDWSLALLAVGVSLASERQRLVRLAWLQGMASLYLWIPLLGGLVFLAGTRQPLGAVAILGFWIGWEMHVWGGADAVAAMALALVWPDRVFILAWLVMNLAAAVGVTLASQIQEHRFRLHQVPGLPLLFLAAVLRVIAQWAWGWH
jgi:hypothetical protein